MNNGSKLDFLDGDDLGSLTSSYSSINGSTFSRFDDAKPVRKKVFFNNNNKTETKLIFINSI